MIEWYYLIIISAVLNALTLIIKKQLLRLEHALSFSASVTFITALLSLSLIPFVSFSISMYQLLLLFLYSFLLALTYWVSARLFRHGSLSTGSALYGILPIIVTVILAFLFLSENLGTVKYFAILVILLAAFIMVEQSNKKRDPWQKRYYDIAIVATTLLIGIANILLKYSFLQQIGIFTFIFFTGIFTPVIIIVLMLSKPTEYKKETITDMKKFIRPIILFSALTLAYRIFLYSAIASTDVSLAIPLSSAVIIIITVLSGGFFFGEHHMRRKLLFSAIMLVAAYFLVVA